MKDKFFRIRILEGAKYLITNNLKYFRQVSFTGSCNFFIFTMSVMRKGNDIFMMWRIVPPGAQDAGFILSVIGIFTFTVDKEVILDE